MPERRQEIRAATATLEQLADELADVLICVDLVAMTARDRFCSLVETRASPGGAKTSGPNLWFWDS
jgi:hypothetical protein